jgi:hypothetical protein
VSEPLRLEASLDEIRAMNRRRFVPGTEAVEGRTLMASSGLNNLFGIQLNTNLNVPVTYQQKSLRINHLPYYLEKISPGRFLPKPELKEIQGALFNIMDGIHKPTQLALNYYNTQLRSVVPKQSINATMIDRLDHAFGVVLTAAQTPPDQITNLKVPLFKLTSQVDTASIQPVVLASNDWTLVLETALAVGRPMPPPSLARIKRNQGIQAGAQHIKTPLHHPTLVGTYHFHTTMEAILFDSGEVVGSGVTRRNNDYHVVITTYLPVGVYKMQLQAVDTVGHVSRPSRPFLIKVVPRKKHPD